MKSFFPLQEGAAWRYSKEGVEATMWVAPDHAVKLNGKDTRIIQHTDGFKQFFSNDAGGLMLHQEVYPHIFTLNGKWVEAAFRYRPPLRFARAMTRIGDRSEYNGKVDVIVKDTKVAELSYNYHTEFLDTEVTPVPFGAFRSLSAYVYVHWWGTAGNHWIENTRGEWIWLARDLGMVMFRDYSGVGRLTSSTLEKPAEYVELSGTVASEGTPLCAMVLANGQHMFSCGGDGAYTLQAPLDENGWVTLFGFCSGMEPFRLMLDPSGTDVTQDIELVPDQTDTNLEVDWGMYMLAQDKVHIRGSVSCNGLGANALVLANGQYMFTNGKKLPYGQFELQVPVNDLCEVTLYAFCSGQAPFKEKKQFCNYVSR